MARIQHDQRPAACREAAGSVGRGFEARLGFGVVQIAEQPAKNRAATRQMAKDQTATDRERLSHAPF